MNARRISARHVNPWTIAIERDGAELGRLARVARDRYDAFAAPDSSCVAGNCTFTVATQALVDNADRLEAAS